MWEDQRQLLLCRLIDNVPGWKSPQNRLSVIIKNKTKHILCGHVGQAVRLCTSEISAVLDSNTLTGDRFESLNFIVT